MLDSQPTQGPYCNQSTGGVIKMARKDIWVLAIWTTAAFIGMVICELI
ncbi:hypothetical protein CHD5UKE2_025 [Escherichia phage vB_EcoS-CHD5UKE2]|uniref:Uncharacterized protein n=1 Tax=Escherichia phage vB_EcoS-CHD5UKE2 TaxID=2865806 RepID=A0A9E7MJJ3_9CAUD|nr:hypothetical protein P9604_gp24 [Escherichia phage vB_EcoS-CHD5UKE2]USL86350.1 hypothetical protein CHD5UKE2_025 [Escherichia phage vB_EcoS-CHD5UKE2]